MSPYFAAMRDSYNLAAKTSKMLGSSEVKPDLQSTGITPRFLNLDLFMDFMNFYELRDDSASSNLMLS